MPVQGPAKYWVIEGKYTDKWEQEDEVHPQDGGAPEAARLLGEYEIAAPYAKHRIRVVRS